MEVAQKKFLAGLHPAAWRDNADHENSSVSIIEVDYVF
jgi:hypothetical protein